MQTWEYREIYLSYVDTLVYLTSCNLGRKIVKYYDLRKFFQS